MSEKDKLKKAAIELIEKENDLRALRIIYNVLRSIIAGN